MKKISKGAKFGFWFGFIGTFVATLGLSIRFIEIIGTPFLAPTRFVLAPITNRFQDLPGLLNILVFALVSGFIYMVLFWIIFKIFGGKSSS